MDKTQVYVLNIIDEGILQVSIARFDLVQLLQVTYETISQYFVETFDLKEGQDIEFIANNAYAEILCVDPTGSNETEYSIWDFGFNGEKNLFEDIESLLMN